MRKSIFLILLTASCAFAQNLTTVTAANIQKAGAPLVSGTLCFTATDGNDTPIGFRIGGGGQEVVAPYCATVTNGAIVGTFSVANPANTSPANIQYRIEVFDQYTRVLKYAGVQFTGPTFNLDNYVPSANLPLGTSVNVLSVGNLTVTGSCSGCAAGSGYNLVEVAGSALAQRLTLNFVSGVSCSDNPSQSRTDCTVSGGGAGTVTSVGLALPNIFSVSGSPVTTSGTLTGALANQTANTVFAGPPSGVAATPGFRALVAADVPGGGAIQCDDGLGDGLNAIPAGTYVSVNCYNSFGVTYTITGIRCFTDNNGTSTLNAANDAGTGLLTAAFTCNNAFGAGTQSATTTIAAGHWVKFTFVSDGATHNFTVALTATR